MVLLGGPRQSGKTTLAKHIAAGVPGSQYFNWDYEPDRLRVTRLDWDEDAALVVFDEIHKRPRWKTWLKGLYDVRYPIQRYLVTGSARLDVYRKGGDSMLGRYHYWRLHPFSLSERPPRMSTAQALQRLMTVGGFPEPFLDGNTAAAKRWRRDRHDRVIRDDIRDLESVSSVAHLQMLLDALRARVSSLVVQANLATDLQVAPKTVKRWLELLEAMYLVFAIRPYAKNLPRSLQKPAKVYFFDNGDVIGDEGARFENLVATHLLKELQFLEDSTGDRWQLGYVRDKEKREVDFVTVCNGVVEELIEAKWADATPSPHLAYFAERLKPRRGCRQIVGQLPTKRAGRFGGIAVVPITDAFPPTLFSR